MTELGCCVNDCTYNDENLCCRDDIKVGGDDAHKACCTCCTSFREEGETTARNSCCSPNHKLDVKCDAVNCRYNDSKICSADHIEVTHSSDTMHGETECSTFKMR